MNSPLLRSILLLLALCLAPAPRVRAEEDWQQAGRTLFNYYANAMQGTEYATFLNACESKSRTLFREFTLWQMGMMSDAELMRVLPNNDNGRPIPLKDLVAMDDNHFWAVYTDTMKKRELAVGEEARKHLGHSGLPTYKLKVLTKYEGVIYMIAERVYEKPSAIPIPLTVLEAIQEEGKWRLVLPREIMWDAMEAGRARQMQLEQAASTLPYDVPSPLRPTEESDLKIPGTVSERPQAKKESVKAEKKAE